MRMRMLLALLFATAAIGPAVAQRSDTGRGGVLTETQDRLNNAADHDLIWNLIGLLGLLGLLRFKRAHSEDGYHPAPLE
jgi:hypothetical protein